MGSLGIHYFPRPRLVWTFRQAGGAAQSLVPPGTSVEGLSQACPLLLPQTGLGFLQSSQHEMAIVFIRNPNTSLRFPTPWYQQTQRTVSGPGELTR